MHRSLVAYGLAACLLSVLAVPPVAADHEYRLRSSLQWDTAQLDVLVTGIDDPLVLESIQTAIAVWQQGITELAPTWLSEGLELRIYIPAVDPVPPAGFEAGDVEIYVIPQGFMAMTLLGDDPVCHAFAPLAHEFVFGGRDSLYRVAAHEFGHCLGLGHVFEHGIEYDPEFDIMGGGRDWACPSNLDVQVLELSYGGLFGRPSGGEVTMPSSEYDQIDC